MLSFACSEHFSHLVCYITFIEIVYVHCTHNGILVAAISWTGSSQLNMHFVMMMRRVKEGMDTAQTGEVVKDPQVEGGLLVLMAEDGRGVAQTMVEEGRGGAQTMAGEVTGEALIMAQMVVAGLRRGSALTMTVSAVKPALAASAVKLVLAMTGPPGMSGAIVILSYHCELCWRHHTE